MAPPYGYVSDEDILDEISGLEIVGAEAVVTTPNKTRQKLIGVESLAIAAGATVNIEVKPQAAFRLERMIIPVALAPDVTVVDVKVGQNSQLAASGAIPGDVFRHDSLVELLCDTASVGNTIVISVTNNTLAAMDFRAALLGVVVQ